MVGITDSNLEAGELCWIVINANPREFYFGQFIGSEENTLALQRLRERVSSPNIKGVKARLIDPRVKSKPPSDGLPFLGEPLCDYAVLPYQEGKLYMKAHSGTSSNSSQWG